MKIIFIEDLPGLYAETFIIADRNKYLEMQADVRHLYLSELEISLIDCFKNALRRPIKSLRALLFILSGYATPRRLLSNCHAWFLFLSNYRHLENELKDASLRCHFLAKRFTFGYLSNLYFGNSYSGVAHATDIFEWDESISIKIASASNVDCISNYNIGYINGKTGFRFSDKLRLSRNGVLLDQIRKRGSSVKESNERAVKFISICRLVEKKGLSDCLDFLSALSNQLDLKWTIIGDGPCHDDLKAQVAKSQIDPNVRFLGQKSQIEISEELSEADYFILLPLNAASGKFDMDGIPTVFMEALDHNVPVISSSVSGIPELIIDGVNGVLFESEKSISSMVESFLNHHRNGFDSKVIRSTIDVFKRTGH